MARGRPPRMRAAPSPPPPPEPPKSRAELAQSYFDELSIPNVDAAYPAAIPDALAQKWIDEAAAGGRGAGYIETNADQARIQLAKIRVASLFIRYRRQINQYRVRAFVPTQLHTPSYENLRERTLEVTGDVPQGRPWVSVEKFPHIQAEHSLARLSQSIGSSVSIHGASLVSLGHTWEDVRQKVHEYADAAVDHAIMCDTTADALLTAEG